LHQWQTAKAKATSSSVISVKAITYIESIVIDHDFLRFSIIFCEKNGVFLKNQCYDQIFALFSFVLSQKRQFFRQNFAKNIF
jgi:hypothetical protein